MTEERYVASAVAALDDDIALRNRLDDIERALSRPLPPGERKELRREYLDLWDRREKVA